MQGNSQKKDGVASFLVVWLFFGDSLAFHELFT